MLQIHKQTCFPPPPHVPEGISQGLSLYYCMFSEAAQLSIICHAHRRWIVLLLIYASLYNNAFSVPLWYSPMVKNLAHYAFTKYIHTHVYTPYAQQIFHYSPKCHVRSNLFNAQNFSLVGENKKQIYCAQVHTISHINKTKSLHLLIA